MRLVRVMAAVMFVPVIYLMTSFRAIRDLHPMWYSMLALSYAAILLAAVVEPPRAISRVLRTRLLQKLGSLSFAIYIFHLPLFAAVQNLMGGRVAAALVAGGLTWMLAQLSADYLEGPLLRRGRRKYRYS